MKNNQQKKEEYLKMNFFKTVVYSICKFEKYPEMAALGMKKAVAYFTKLILIFSILFTTYYVISANNINANSDTLSAKTIRKLLENYNYTDEQKEEMFNTLNESIGNAFIIILFIGMFISIYLTTLLDVITLSIFGLLTCFFVKIKINYKALFNMSIYAITLSTILRMIYSGITMLTDFNIKYFDLMYNAVSYIILAASIFMIKSDVIKQQLQLIDIIEETKEKMSDEKSNSDEPDKDETENEKKDDKKEKNQNEDGNTGKEQESNA